MGESGLQSLLRTAHLSKAAVFRAGVLTEEADPRTFEQPGPNKMTSFCSLLDR